MKDPQNGFSIPSHLYSLSEKPSLDDFTTLCSQTTKASQYPLAHSIQNNIPIYDLSEHSSTSSQITARLQDEWHAVLYSGPGVYVVKNLYTSNELLNTTNEVFNRIITSEASTSRGDHFSSGANSRIWNSFQKHGMTHPSSFIPYYSNPWLSLISSSWLGPAYRITAQVNIVKPGGAPQVCHRDYHLGFQTAEACAKFPRAMQKASQLLTLQGAVAHSDMPLESGPTRFLPFSQAFAEGFMAYRLPDFNEYFLKHYVSLPLEKGDGVFFNPALFHAAGENRTQDIERSANLLQISSAFGKPMESISTLPLIERCWEGLVEMHKKARAEEVEAFVAAVAEGYPFPTNLDKRPPGSGGLAPESEQEVLMRGLKDGWGVGDIVREIRALQDCSK